MITFLDSIRHVGADPDGDGMSNWQEYAAGTDPTDGQSYLKIDSIIRTKAQVILQFLAVSNKIYTVQFRAADQGLFWDRVANVAGNATNSSIQITDPALPGANASRFYRSLTPMIP